jgi:esterase/lipase
MDSFGTSMINYIDVGKGKETLILISGLGQRYDKSWIPQYNLAMHYRLIIPSLRGHYESGINTDITLENMALDIVELMEYLHIKEAHICGLSLGGIVAQELYRVHPEKVKSLILCNTTFYIPSILGNKVIEKSSKVLELGKNELVKRIVNAPNNSLGIEEKNYIKEVIKRFKGVTITEIYISYLSVCRREKRFKTRSLSTVYSLIKEIDMINVKSYEKKNNDGESLLLKSKEFIVIFKVIRMLEA